MGKEEIDSRPEILKLSEDAIPGYRFNIGKTGAAEPIGSGGSGIVFKATQTVADGATLPRAIKFFLYRDDIAKNKADGKVPISKEDFASEVYNITNLNHQNLVKVISAGFAPCDGGDVPYIITDFISGPTLKELCGRGDDERCSKILNKIDRSPDILIDILVGVGSAVEYIYNRGFSHCDIAPKNIFIENLDSGVQPVLGDLGISKPLDQKSATRKTVFIAGSRSWVPDPVKEVLENEVNYKTFVNLQPYWDIYSFCKTGLELVNRFSELSDNSWYEALKKSLEKGLEEGGYRSFSQVVDQLHFLKPIQREVAGVPELSNGIGTGVRRMMPVEPLKATRRLNDLVKHPAIFRLSKVPQLTTSNHILPGSGHTRYEHTLGTLETMRRYLLSLLDEKEFLQYFSVDRIETALVSAALSSATRFPLSNVVHEMRARDKSQYTGLSKANVVSCLSVLKDKKGRTLSNVVEEYFKNTSPDRVFDIIGKGFVSDEGDQLISSMLKSSLDVRVVDFLRRDSHHLGIISGDTFDLDEILLHLTVSDHRLALKETGVSVAEHIVSLRYWLFSRAYWNRPNRSYFAMVRYVLSSLHEVDPDCLGASEVIDSDQNSMLRLLKCKCQEKGLLKSELLVQRLIENENKIYKLALEVRAQDLPYDVVRRLNCISYDSLDDLTNDLEHEFWKFCESWVEGDEKAILLDFPAEPGNIKMGGDIDVDTRFSGKVPLTDYSLIAKGVSDSFVYQLPSFRVYRNPLIEIKGGCTDILYEFCKSKLIEKYSNNS